MKVAKNISDGIDFGRSLGGGSIYMYTSNMVEGYKLWGYEGCVDIDI